MERGVIETFDLLRPNIKPHFLLSYTANRLDLPLLAEIKRRNFSYTFFSDKKGWGRVGKPKSLKHLIVSLYALIKGNIDVLRSSAHQDSLYLPGVLYFNFAFLASVYFRLKRRRVIYHFHDLILNRSILLKLATPFISDFIHNTEVSYQMVINSNPCIKGKNNLVIPYPVSERQHVQNNGDAKRFFEGNKNIIFIGQVSKHKGVDLLVDAFKIIADDYPDAALHIVGGIAEPSFQKELQQKSSSLNLRIHFWGYRDDALCLLKMSHIHVLPSPPKVFNESFGIVVAEAMALGIPTVCFRSGALQELVVHNQTGLVCEQETPENIAEALRRFLDEPEFRDDCGRRAQERYRDRYSHEQIKTRWLDLFEDKR
jgi:glycosyltransferase involved in cell wall biosynthesis